MQDQRILQNSSTASLPFYLTQATDDRAGAIDASPTVVISRCGAPFAAPAGSMVQKGQGWYALQATPDDVASLGPLLLHAEADGCDATDVRFEVIPSPGVAPLIQGSTRYPLTFLLIDATDHVSGVPGVLPDVAIAKLGGAFAAPAGTVYEVGNSGPHPVTGQGRGWYCVGPDPADYDTPGPLLLHAGTMGADDTDDKFDVTGASAFGLGNEVAATLVAVKTMLINSGLFGPAAVVISLEREPFTAPAPPCCWIAPGNFPLNMPYLTGGGRYETVVAFEFSVRVIVRRASDIQGQDVEFLTNASRGGYPAVFAVLNALTEQFPMDVSGQQLTTTGLKPINVGNPYRYGKDEMMGVVEVRFSADVLLGIRVPEPA